MKLNWRKLPCLIFPLVVFLLISDLGNEVGAIPQLNKTVQLIFPTPILEGRDLTMNCRFKVNETSQIYQVKWYKGRREIFRYTPSESPPGKILTLEDVTNHIDENRSDMNKLVLRRVPMALKGNVSCEVSWETSFTTFTDTNQLLVVLPPATPPILNVTVANGPSLPFSRGTLKLNFGEVLTIRCVGGPSIPAPNLTFFINEYDYRSQRGITLRDYELSKDLDNRTESRMATISLKLDHSHFLKQRIRVKCNSKMFNLHEDNSTEFVGELQSENTIKASGYGGKGVVGKNSQARIQPFSGKLIWSIGVCSSTFFLLSLRIFSC